MIKICSSGIANIAYKRNPGDAIGPALTPSVPTLVRLLIGLTFADKFYERRRISEIHTCVVVGSTGRANYTLVPIRSHALASDTSIRFILEFKPA